MKDAGQMFKVLSVLLQYPDADLIDSLPELEHAIDTWLHSEVRKECRRFLAHLRATSLEELQTEYTARIDFDPGFCLNLTFHECGDSRKRGHALVHLKELYKSAGYDLSTSELPDFLPVMLEFLSVCSDEGRIELLSRYGDHIAGLASRLRDRGSAYSCPLEALSMLIPEFVPAGD